jgi:hypothetical protein
MQILQIKEDLNTQSIHLFYGWLGACHSCHGNKGQFSTEKILLLTNMHSNLFKLFTWFLVLQTKQAFPTGGQTLALNALLSHKCEIFIQLETTVPVDCEVFVKP